MESSVVGMTGRPGRVAAAGLIVALLGPTALQRIPAPFDSVSAGILVDNLVMWLLAGVTVGLVVAWERRGLGSIGVRRPSWRLVLLALGGGLVITAAGLAATGAFVALSGVQQPPQGLEVLGDLSWGHKVLIVVTAAVTEEILYRGYPIERLTELTGRLWLAAAVSGAVFLAVHLPFWGPAAVPLQATATIGLVGLYVWKRNLPVVMIAHATINGILLLLLPALA